MLPLEYGYAVNWIDESSLSRMNSGEGGLTDDGEYYERNAIVDTGWCVVNTDMVWW